MNKKVLVVGGSHGLSKWFSSNGFDLTRNPFEADMFQFMGGEDVTPEIYGQKNTDSFNNLERDMHEMGFYALARRLDKPMVGICRGGQFLNVMCGGSMIQNTTGHTRSHKLFVGGGKEIMATSTHHQMMQPGPRAKLLATGPSVDGVEGEGVEVVFYEHERCLCFQPHPEYHTFPELEEYYFGLINNLLMNR